MNASCRDFQTLLESRLARRTGRSAQGTDSSVQGADASAHSADSSARNVVPPAHNAVPKHLADLAWHEHLFTCEACRALLDAEEALELLLASLPEPRLEPAVRDRVLARLRNARAEERLDSLLDLAGTAHAPSELSRSVIVSVTQRVADERLDRLLDLDVVTVPEGLADRTRTALRLARRTATARPGAETVRLLTPPRARPIAWRLAGFAAAAAVLAAIAWIVRGLETPRDPAPPAIVDMTPSGADRTAVGSSNAPVSDEMLAALDVLENWDVLVTDDVETLLSTLPEDAAVLLEDLEDEG